MAAVHSWCLAGIVGRSVRAAACTEVFAVCCPPVWALLPRLSVYYCRSKGTFACPSKGTFACRSKGTSAWLVGVPCRSKVKAELRCFIISIIFLVKVAISKVIVTASGSGYILDFHNLFSLKFCSFLWLFCLLYFDISLVIWGLPVSLSIYSWCLLTALSHNLRSEGDRWKHSMCL